MKARFWITVTMLVAGVVTTALADEPARFAVVKRCEGVYKVIYTGTASQTIITVKNRFGETVFTERINSAKGFILPLNFSKLTPGLYTVEVNAGGERYVEEVYHGVTGTSNTPLVAHVARIAASRYLLSVKSGAPVTLYVQNAQGETMAAHNFTTTESAWVISLKDFAGRPVFVVQDENGQTVTIEK